MTDINLDIQRQMLALQNGHEQLRKADVAALYLPWTQRVLNPFPLASSNTTFADMPQPWSNTPLAFYVSVFVNTTNTGAAFWTVNLQSIDSAGAATTIASVSTAALAPNTPARLSDTTVTASATTDVWYRILPVATGSPGSIFIFPALALLRTGN